MADSLSNSGSAVLEDTAALKGAKPLGDGTYELPRFPILDDCTFFNRKKGEWVTLSKDRLEKIADRINHQYRSVHTAIAIIPGHTQDGIPEVNQPPVIGKGIDARVEPLRNPATGEPTGKNAIYVTPIADNAKAVGTFAKLRRGRSVELWLNPDDVTAIALLGATAPRRDLGPHLFSQMGPMRFNKEQQGHEPIYFEMEDDKKEPSMADEEDATIPKKTPPADSPADGGGDGVDPKLVDAIFAKFMQSDVYKKLEAMVAAAPAPGAAGPGGAAPAPGGDLNAPSPDGQGGDGTLSPEDYDDIFADDGDDHGGQPSPNAPAHDDKDKAKLAACETRMAAEPLPSQTHIPSRETDMENQQALIRLARTEQENAELKQRLGRLEQKDLSHQVMDELRKIEREGIVFDFEREHGKLVRLGRADDRRLYYEDMRLNYKRREDTLPNDGNYPVDPNAQEAIQMQREDRMSDDEAYAVGQELARRTHVGGEKGLTVDKIRMERRERAASANGTVKVS